MLKRLIRTDPKCRQIKFVDVKQLNTCCAWASDGQ